MQKCRILYINSKQINIDSFDSESYDIDFLDENNAEIIKKYIKTNGKYNIICLNKPDENIISVLKLKYNYPETKFVIITDREYSTTSTDIINKYADSLLKNE